MDCFSSSPLVESFPSTRFSSPAPSPTRTEMDLPIEVDQSFNSSMSFGGNSPSPSPNMNKPLPASPLLISSSDFLSPTPAFMLKPRRPDPVPIQCRLPLGTRKTMDVPKGLALSGVSTKRTFGQEVSLNSMTRPLGNETMGKGMMLPPALPDSRTMMSKRGGVSMQWTSSNDEPAVPKLRFSPAMIRLDTEPIMMSPRSSSGGSGMDLDSPCLRPSSLQHSPAFSAAGSLSGSPDLGSFFHESPAPSLLPLGKRRSLVTGSPVSPSSPSAKRASFGLGRNIEKTASSSAMLFGGGAAASSSRLNTARRTQKRPPPVPMPPLDTSQRSTSANSAYPILCGTKNTLQVGGFPRSSVAPMRRAFSVCAQPNMPEMSEEESESEESPSNAAEYARRHGQRVVPRIDGSPSFKPMRQSFAPTGQGAGASPVKGKKPSPFSGGLPGFGDNEMDGKILPCHKVKEDGLVRITPETLDGLIAGEYQSRLRRFHILDCRFDYEYAGGHIDGAINVKSMDALDELLLSESLGVHANGDILPEPSRSGDQEEGEQVVLVFHCEFSAKRAPTFAKHLRSRDRSLNGHLYPKIYYPEVYILEGGYCGFYKSQPQRCEPQGYVPMDDPRHFERRNSDLHDFRKFSRTRSFTYGETQPQPIRALPCPSLAFAAASVAVGRRHGPTISITEEEHDIESSPNAADTSAEMDDTDSPCNCVSKRSVENNLYLDLRNPVNSLD